MERQRKRELRELNARAWDGETVFRVQPTLDSNLKKNTAFIKRLRTAITPTGAGQFLLEVKSLSLHKYLTEIVSACYEGLTKLKTAGEISAGVEVVSALHQRFGPDEFTKYLAWLVGNGLLPHDKAQLKALPAEVREREEKERIMRQRNVLRMATELWLVGVLKGVNDVAKPEEATRQGKNNNLTPRKANGVLAEQPDTDPLPLEALKNLLNHDRDLINLPLVVTFVKSFAWDVLGSSLRKDGSKLSDGPTEIAQNSPNDNPLTPPDTQKRFKNVIQRYFEQVLLYVAKDKDNLTAQGKRNAEAYVRSGEVFEDRQASYERATKAHEKVVTSAQVLAEALGAEMPDLTEKDAAEANSESVIGLVKAGEYLRGQGDAGIWEDEEERRFYENLVDLKDRVPGILLEDGKKGKSSEDVKKAEREEATKTPDADDSTAIANKTVGAQVDALLSRLPEFTNKEQVDQFALDFCFVNSKASRNRLIKAIQVMPKGRTDLLPLYARLIATLGRYLTDIPQAIISTLDDEFRSLQRRKAKDFLGQVRLSNVRYLSELTKFGVVPEHVIFHCLKVSLDDFSRMNLEIIACLLENCGRYLLRHADTAPRMGLFLETLQRKKAAQHLGQQERMLIENAIYYVNPPERAAIEQKERTTLDLYVRKLIYLDLNKKTADKITKQIRKLHWEEPEVVQILRKIFVKPGKIRYSHVNLLAVLLGALYRFHADFAISVIDDVLERITAGLETNNFKYNQSRLAEVRYLGEMYVYRLVDSNVIFDTLYNILNYGHEPYAQRGKLSPYDLPDDFFRIRLVATLLETCGVYFEKGAVRKKLDFYLTFLQYYINVKDPLPMDVEFVVQDLFTLLRPQWKPVLNDLSEASRLFAEACKRNFQANTNKAVETEEVDERDDNGQVRGTPSSQSEAGEVMDPIDKSSFADEQIVVTLPEDERDPEAEAEFDRELAKLMAENVESRLTERRALFDAPLPIRRTARDQTHTSETAVPESDKPAPGTIRFSLLSKKGNRQQTRAINLPSDSNLAVALRTQQEAERAEQQRIKSLVLNYELSESENTIESLHGPRVERPAGNARKQQRVRKLQIGDLDWLV
ncbi:ARM repeat-containing protein [Piedraia hortae CBS 480.64]|uniref:ARM repeat-containing protein n=1 Tax=Piedraia hortae CBS 480.64 TaxID=1314780 RepID=A0A6A7BZB9_9PEZI|nr:ARM repeat-containing protein [Piedraia hortae CBS 480.64]